MKHELVVESDGLNRLLKASSAKSHKPCGRNPVQLRTNPLPIPCVAGLLTPSPAPDMGSGISFMAERILKQSPLMGAPIPTDLILFIQDWTSGHRLKSRLEDPIPGRRDATYAGTSDQSLNYRSLILDALMNPVAAKNGMNIVANMGVCKNQGGTQILR